MPCRYGTAPDHRVSVELVEADIEIGFYLVDLVVSCPADAARLVANAEEVYEDVLARITRLEPAERVTLNHWSPNSGARSISRSRPRSWLIMGGCANLQSGLILARPTARSRARATPVRSSWHDFRLRAGSPMPTAPCSTSNRSRNAASAESNPGPARRPLSNILPPKRRAAWFNRSNRFLTSRTLKSTDVFGRRLTLEDLIARILRDLRRKGRGAVRGDRSRPRSWGGRCASSARTRTTTTLSPKSVCGLPSDSPGTSPWSSNWSRWRRRTTTNPRSIMTN